MLSGWVTRRPISGSPAITTNIYLTGGTPATLQITIGNQVNADYRIEQVEFVGGTTWDITTLFENSRALPNLLSTVSGTAGDDILTSTSNSQAIIGGAGNDVLTAGGPGNELQGGSGSDTYVLKHVLLSGDHFFDFDDGVQRHRYPPFPGTGILASNTSVTRDQYNLYLTNSSGKVTISNWFTSPEYQVEQVGFLLATGQLGTPRCCFQKQRWLRRQWPG